MDIEWVMYMFFFLFKMNYSANGPRVNLDFGSLMLGHVQRDWVINFDHLVPGHEILIDLQYLLIFVTGFIGILNPKSGFSSSVSLSNGRKIHILSTMGGETGIALFLSLLGFKSIDGDLLCLPTLIPISSLLHSLSNLSIFGLLAKVSSKQYFYMYINVPHNDFGTLKYST